MEKRTAFAFAKGKKPQEPCMLSRKKPKFPWISAAVLALIVIGCLCAEFLAPHDPAYLDLAHRGAPPSMEFYFGTDPMGRDLFSMIWYGGQTSLFIGITAMLITTVIAMVYGAAAALAPKPVETALLWISSLLLSIPSLLLVIFLQAIWGEGTPFSLALAIGFTGWMPMAQVVYSTVKQLHGCDYLLAAKQAGSGFFHRLFFHLFPNFFPAIAYMAISSLSGAILAESTLSFLGIGLPVETISWGSMLSRAGDALLSGQWWVIVIPGIFLAATLVCMVELSTALRRRDDSSCSYL